MDNFPILISSMSRSSSISISLLHATVVGSLLLVITFGDGLHLHTHDEHRHGEESTHEHTWIAHHHAVVIASCVGQPSDHSIAACEHAIPFLELTGLLRGATVHASIPCPHRAFPAAMQPDAFSNAPSWRTVAVIPRATSPPLSLFYFLPDPGRAPPAA